MGCVTHWYWLSEGGEFIQGRGSFMNCGIRVTGRTLNCAGMALFHCIRRRVKRPNGMYNAAKFKRPIKDSKSFACKTLCLGHCSPCWWVVDFYLFYVLDLGKVDSILGCCIYSNLSYICGANRPTILYQ